MRLKVTTLDHLRNDPIPSIHPSIDRPDKGLTMISHMPDSGAAAARAVGNPPPGPREIPDSPSFPSEPSGITCV